MDTPNEPAPTNAPSAKASSARKWARNALLALAFGSLVYVAAKEFADHRRARSADAVIDATAPVDDKVQLVVYYFAEGKDCTTCENLAAFTKEAIMSEFAGELASGAVVWRAYNVDEKRYEHFVTDYNLYTKSVVLARMDHGRQLRWKNLESVWDYVYDKPAFIRYVQTQARAFMDAAP